MSKREAEKLASEIWAFKDEHEAATGCIISLPEATAVFLERRFFAIPRLVIEVCGQWIRALYVLHVLFEYTDGLVHQDEAVSVPLVWQTCFFQKWLLPAGSVLEVI
jgi:hypothetical protein